MFLNRERTYKLEGGGGVIGEYLVTLSVSFTKTTKLN